VEIKRFQPPNRLLGRRGNPCDYEPLLLQEGLCGGQEMGAVVNDEAAQNHVASISPGTRPAHSG
jgi:hypothetical protein